MKRLTLIGLILVSAFSFSGCALLLIGAGVAGGVAISDDTVSLNRDTSYRRAFAAAEDVINEMGLVDLSDEDAGKIEGIVKDSKVLVSVVPITSKAVRIDVKVRKNLLPNIDVATEIINKINAEI